MSQMTFIGCLYNACKFVNYTAFIASVFQINEVETETVSARLYALQICLGLDQRNVKCAGL